MGSGVAGERLEEAGPLPIPVTPQSWDLLLLHPVGQEHTWHQSCGSPLTPKQFGDCKETGNVVDVSCLWPKSCSNLLMCEIMCRQPELVFTVMLSRIISSASQASLYLQFQPQATLLQTGAYAKAGPVFPKEIPLGLGSHTARCAPHRCETGQSRQ